MRFFTILLCSLLLAAAEKKPAATKKPEPAAEQQGPIKAAAQRNENVPVYQIDNNAIKEANIRLGSAITYVGEPAADRSYFGAEFGRKPAGIVTLPATSKRPSWHAATYFWHQNSVFNARTFFQVGGVKPSRRNLYGGNFSVNLDPKTYFSGDVSGRKIRGMVNGNVLVPSAGERAPRATDPAVRAEVQRFLNAFGDELPNRPDFDRRALNTNSPQRIDQLAGTLRLDRDVTTSSRLSLSYNNSRMTEHAFQLVAGMNPDTEIHSQRARASYTVTPNALTEVSLGAGFDRARSVLVPESNAVGPRVRFGFQIQELG
ncbi:MAG: hypothetical protein GY953_17605, partial [bacterium]|nr:hypothetical protein [bacterium]